MGAVLEFLHRLDRILGVILKAITGFCFLLLLLLIGGQRLLPFRAGLLHGLVRRDRRDGLRLDDLYRRSRTMAPGRTLPGGRGLKGGEEAQAWIYLGPRHRSILPGFLPPLFLSQLSTHAQGRRYHPHL